ncbi:MAG: hypothetical protein AB1657_00965 [Candidatus Micrarchaeota archaeon]
MRLLAESLLAALIALFVLNFLGLGVSLLASVTSFFVVLLFIVLIEEKSGFSSRAILRQFRMDRPLIATAVVFGLLFVLAIVFSIINTRLSAFITPLTSSLESTLGLIGLAVISALAYRLFYHFMYQQIELDTGLQLVKKIRSRI